LIGEAIRFVVTEVSQDIGEARSHARRPEHPFLLPECPPLCLMRGEARLV
jgi:hypothetical protein